LAAILIVFQFFVDAKLEFLIQEEFLGEFSGLAL
jgi:hypothetical protein